MVKREAWTLSAVTKYSGPSTHPFPTKCPAIQHLSCSQTWKFMIFLITKPNRNGLNQCTSQKTSPIPKPCTCSGANCKRRQSSATDARLQNTAGASWNDQSGWNCSNFYDNELGILSILHGKFGQLCPSEFVVLEDLPSQTLRRSCNGESCFRFNGHPVGSKIRENPLKVGSRDFFPKTLCDPRRPKWWGWALEVESSTSNPPIFVHLLATDGSKKLANHLESIKSCHE